MISCTIGYTYTLLDNTSGDATSVSFPVVVTDADLDASTPSSLVINIVDDVPTAVADTNSVATPEGGAATANRRGSTCRPIRRPVRARTVRTGRR
mgnify:CR=1 FL=1